MNLGTLDDPVDAEVSRRMEERVELMRVAAVSALNRSRGGRDLDPGARNLANHWASVKPLGRPLSDGSPAVQFASMDSMELSTHRQCRVADLDEARTIWSYDSGTGHLTWLVNPGPTEMIGKRIGVGPYSNGVYVTVFYKGHGYKAHRLAWLLHYGVWPKHEIDHINGNRADNRISNLRDVPHHVNQMNQKRHRT